MSFQAMEPRTIICPVCKVKDTEDFFGSGFPDWLRLMDVFDDSTKENPILCPECKKLLMQWLNGNAIITLKEKK